MASKKPASLSSISIEKRSVPTSTEAGNSKTQYSSKSGLAKAGSNSEMYPADYKLKNCKY